MNQGMVGSWTDVSDARFWHEDQRFVRWEGAFIPKAAGQAYAGWRASPANEL